MEPASSPSSPSDAYRLYGAALVRKAERMLRSRDDALDVVQALFVEIMQRKVDTVDLPYLYRAVGNRCLNVLRDASTRARLLEREQPALIGPARVRCDDRMIGLELLGQLAERLDARDQEVLVARYVDEMSQDEIAEHLGTSRKTVGKRLAKIRDQVRALTGDVRLPDSADEADDAPRGDA